MNVRLATLLALGFPGMAAAQGVGSVTPLYEMSKGWLIKSAELMPEANYAFKPTPDVRSFGQLIGHVANANYMFCSSVLGEKNPAAQDLEKTTDRATLVKGLKDAFAYCDGAYQITNAKAGEPIEFFGMKGDKLWALMFNVAHNNEHYGNLVTYFRLKGMVPPSSQGNAM